MEKTENRTRWLGVLLLLTLFLILIVRCFFSFCQTDESFYAAMVNRLWTGDHLVWDEWNSTQFYTPLILPYYALFILIHGSTEGVILFLRLLYVLFALLTAIKLFRLINHDTGNPVYSAAAASLVLIYSRANIQGPSYYNLCMLCCTSAFCSFTMASYAATAAGYRGMQLWSGVLLACGVLCNPFLAPIVFLMVLVGLLVVQTRRETSAVLAGIVLMALIYCTYLAVTTGVSHFVEGLPYLFINPEQSNIMQNLSMAVHEAIHVSKYVAIPSVLMTVCLLFLWNAPQRRKRTIALGYCAIQTLMLALTGVKTVTGICGAVLVAATAAAFPICIKAILEKKRETATGLYVFGLINALAFILASNTGVDAGIIGFTMSAAAGLWLFYKDLEIGSNDRKICRMTLALMAMVILLPLLCQRVIGVYRDAPLGELTTELTQGPAKGLRTTPEHAAQYESICSALTEFSEKVPAGRILYCKNLPWAYLQTEGFGYGTSSPWRTYTEDVKLYYSVRQGNRASYICILAENVAGWEKSRFNRNPGVRTPNAFDYDDPFWEMVQGAPIVQETEFFRIYDVRGLW